MKISKEIKMQENNQKNKKRNVTLIILGGLFTLIIVSYVIYYKAILQYRESTDNAYVGGNIVAISSQIPGTISRIVVDDTQYVKKGQLLIKLDAKDADLTLERAKGNLAKTVRSVAKLYKSVDAARLEIKVLETNLQKARDDLSRRCDSDGIGVVSAEELEHTKESVQIASQALDAKQSELEAIEKETNGISLEQNPSVQLAKNELQSAVLNLKRTEIFAPQDGFIAKRNAQIGEKINAGMPLMAVVGLQNVWVDANFKETEIKNIRVGQPVELVSDLYGSDEHFHGKVIGFSAGTGGVFSLLPPQNASGNWIKIVQRLAVRISIDKNEVAKRALRIGTSMTATVDTHDRSGKALEADEVTNLSGSFYDDAQMEADKLFGRIVKENK
jgi:membrane fusion protein (multidrug efflux system)